MHISTSIDGHRLEQQTNQLHDLSLTKCHDMLPDVLEIIKLHVPDSHDAPDLFFAYDASIVRDGCFFAAILLTTRESGALGTTEAELRADINHCISALRAMRWAFAKSEEREQSIEQAWDRRVQRLNVSPTQATFPARAFSCTMPPMPSDRPTPPLLPVPVLRDSRPPTSSVTWPGMSVAPSPAAGSSTDHTFAYGSYPNTPAQANFNPPAMYQPFMPTVTTPESAGSRPSTAGGVGGEQVVSLSHHTLSYPGSGSTSALEQQYLVNSRLDTTSHNAGLSHSAMPRGSSHGMGLGIISSSSSLPLLSSDLASSTGHVPYLETEPTSASSSYATQLAPWETLHIAGPRGRH
jgi:hypothetical protein